MSNVKVVESIFTVSNHDNTHTHHKHIPKGLKTDVSQVLPNFIMGLETYPAMFRGECNA